MVDVERRLSLADEAVDRADQARERAEGELETADSEVTAARTGLRAGVAQWAASHGSVVTPDDAEAVTLAVDTFGDEGSPTLVDTWHARLDPRRHEVVGHRSALAVEAARVAEHHAALEQRRQAIAAEADDAPPPLPWRGGGRHGRAGAPLWRLVRFADGVGPADAAGIEAALEAAGLLDAWVRPDGSVDADAGGSEAFLAAGAADGGPAAATLASVLVPEDQDEVPSAVVVRLLEAVALGDPPPEPGREPDAAGAEATPRPVVSVARGGTYRLGPLAGRHRVDAPRYIGATARAAHRAARLAALDAELAALDTERANVDARLAELAGWLAAADAAVAGLPSGGRAGRRTPPARSGGRATAGRRGPTSTTLSRRPRPCAAS